MAGSHRERAVSAAAASGMVALFACVLIFGLQAGPISRAAAGLVSLTFAPPPPPLTRQRKPKPAPAHASAARDAPSPRNLRNQATPIVAPPVTILISPPPVIAALQAGAGAAAASGAADVPGQGQGAGGSGNGLGGGGAGDGGGGDGGGADVGPRQIKGRLSFSDLPDGVLPDGGEVAVGVRYIVGIDGRVNDCHAAKSSGYAVIDDTVCRLIQQRFRFRPALNRAGQPMRSVIVETHGWINDPGKAGNH